MTDYHLIRSGKRKTVAIEVHRDQRVVVRVPSAMSKWEINRLVRTKEQWIIQQQNRQATLPQKTSTEDYRDNSEHFYLGKTLQLSYATINSIKLQEPYLLIPSKDRMTDAEGHTDFQRISKKLKEWYRSEARAYYSDRLKHWLQQISHWQAPSPQLRLRYMRCYWGSCNSKHWITLNVELIKTPPEMIDYVITHELCHLKEMNHSPAFYQLQESLLPDWRQRRQQLRLWEQRVLP